MLYSPGWFREDMRGGGVAESAGAVGQGVEMRLTCCAQVPEGTEGVPADMCDAMLLVNE